MNGVLIINKKLRKLTITKKQNISNCVYTVIEARLYLQKQIKPWKGESKSNNTAP